MDVMITWDFEIRWLRNFSLFLMKARLFDGVMKIYCAQMSEAWNKKNKKYIPCALNKTKRGQRDQCRGDEQQTTSNNSPSVGFSAAAKGTRSREPFGRGVGGQRTPSRNTRSSCPISWPLLPLPGKLQCDWGLSKQSIRCPA